MRGSITLLQYEHGVIRQVTDVLAEMVRRGSLSRQQRQVIRISEFMDSYVLRLHHMTEEKFLFKEALSLSSELSRGVRELMSDHEQVSALISRFKQLSIRKEAYTNGTLELVAKQLVETVTRHLLREESDYFPKIEEALSMEQDADLLREIDKFTTSKFGSGFLRLFEDKAAKIRDEALGPGHYQGVQ